MPEMWGRCDPCNRAFFVPFTTGEQMARARCPVCATAPSNFEVRTDTSSFDVDLTDAQTDVLAR